MKDVNTYFYSSIVAYGVYQIKWDQSFWSQVDANYGKLCQLRERGLHDILLGSHSYNTCIVFKVFKMIL